MYDADSADGRGWGEGGQGVGGRGRGVVFVASSRVGAGCFVADSWGRGDELGGGGGGLEWDNIDNENKKIHFIPALAEHAYSSYG